MEDDNINLEELIRTPEEEEIIEEPKTNDYADNLLDVQIVVQNLKSAEILIKAIDNMDLKQNYNMNISSIIPNNDLEFIKNATIDSDLILITTELTTEGKERFIQYYKELKTDYNYVEYLIFSNNGGSIFTETSQVEEEIQKSIIRASLTSMLSHADINQIQKQLYFLKKDYHNLENNNEQITKENDTVINQAKIITEENIKLKEEINNLNRNLDNIKSEYSDFKARFSDIRSKNLLESFHLKALWEETFDEIFTKYEETLEITNQFQPENILIGQNYIAAKTKEEAIDWLKIIRTTLIFVGENPDLKTNLNNTQNQNSDYQENNTETFNTLPNIWDD